MPPLAEVDWTVIVSSVGTATVAVVGAIGWQVYRVKSARWAFEREQKAADDKAAAGRKAGDRRDRKDAIDEYQELLENQRRDLREFREEVHGLRDGMSALGNRLAVCEWDRSRLNQMVEDMNEAVRRAGIVVHFRPPPPHPTPVYTGDEMDARRTARRKAEPPPGDAPEDGEDA